MFDEFMGLPMHPLVVHAAVVLVPLLVLAALVYALLPRLRGRVGWVAALLALAAPVAAYLAVESGEALERQLADKGYPPELLRQVSEHAEYGDLTFWFTLGLAIATGLLIAVTSGSSRLPALPSWVALVLSALTVVLALVATGYVYLTGDSGAQAVWSGF